MKLIKTKLFFQCDKKTISILIAKNSNTILAMRIILKYLKYVVSYVLQVFCVYCAHDCRKPLS